MNKLLFIPTIRKLLEPTFRGMTRTSQTEVDPTKPKVISRKAKEHEERITLIGPDNSVSIMQLASAQNLSIRRELKLVKIEDVNAKTRRPVYKLMTNREYYEEELQKRREKKDERQSLSKGDKLVTISTRIGKHDLMTRIKNTVKWLEKKHEVRIVITGEKDSNMKESEDIYSTFVTGIKEHGKIVQKRTKGNSLRFQIVPEAKESDVNSKASNETTDDGNETKFSSDQGPL